MQMTQLIAVCTLARILAFKTCLLKKKLNRRGLKLLRHIGSFSVESGLLQQTGSFQYVISTEELAILWYVQKAVAQCARTGQEGLLSSPLEDRAMSSPAADRYISFLLSRIECRMFSSTVLCAGSRFNFFLCQTLLY